MAYNHEYPYVDPNRYNSDWELNKVKALEEEMKNFEALNKITFSGEWDITKQYPAWTIVNDNNGRDGYISIQPVPAGVTIDNADYWRSVANYSDIIADLQNRMIQAENAIDALEGELNHSNKGVHGTNVLLLLDSFGLVGWGDIGNYIAGKMGSGFNVTVDATAGYSLYSMADKLDLIDDGTYDDILIVCGTNDIYTSTAEIDSNRAHFEEVVTGKYKQTVLHYAFCAVHYNHPDMMARIRYCNMSYEEMCGELGIDYLGNFNKWLFPAFQFVKADGVHPNVEGGKRLASAIGKAFCDCCEIYNSEQTYTDTTNSVNFAVTFDILNGSMVFKIRYLTGSNVSLSTTYYPISIPTDNWQDLSSIGDAGFTFMDPRSSFSSGIYFSLSGGAFQWSVLSSGTYRLYNFEMSAISPVDIDTAVNG